MSDDGAEEKALEAARRVYDRHLTILENIDDVSMRTFRTNILIFGFIAAAITAGGPDAASSLHWFPVVIGIVGSGMLLLSAFICIAVYNLTEYSNEVRMGDLKASRRVNEEQWEAGALGRMAKIMPETVEEVQQNGEYLALAQGLSLTGTTALAYGTFLAVISNSYGVGMTPVVWIHGTVAVLVVVAVFAKRFRLSGRII